MYGSVIFQMIRAEKWGPSKIAFEMDVQINSIKTARMIRPGRRLVQIKIIQVHPDDKMEPDAHFVLELPPAMAIELRDSLNRTLVAEDVERKKA